MCEKVSEINKSVALSKAESIKKSNILLQENFKTIKNLTNTIDKRIESSFHLICKTNNLEKLEELLLNFRAKSVFENKASWYLIYALICKSVAVYNKYLNITANIFDKLSDYAICEIFERTLECEAYIEAKQLIAYYRFSDIADRLPRFILLKPSNLEILQILLEKPYRDKVLARFDEDDYFSLEYAIESNNFEAVKILLELPRVKKVIAKDRNRLLMTSFVCADSKIIYLLLKNSSVVKQLRRDYFIYGHSDEESPYAGDSNNEYRHYFSKEISYPSNFFSLLIETAYPDGVSAIPEKVKSLPKFKENFGKFVDESKLHTLGLFEFCSKKANNQYLPCDIVNYINSFLYGYKSKLMSQAGIKLLCSKQKDKSEYSLLNYAG